jgi:hypothetical protein
VEGDSHARQRSHAPAAGATEHAPNSARGNQVRSV